MNPPIRILRLKDVQQRIGISRPTVYRWLDKDPSFPKPVSLGSHSIGFVESEIDAWLEARVRASRGEVAA
ncbi:hypothetical protein PCO31110_02902 [Pandoraea communis]|uniref:AlpA family transcriptional regulator n=1 Tax=Pandoraea communis TaxID=2508297 RepID=A0A5E4VXA4_9BURK|nr:AlpA family transcriptional regulator [Pandoraea communis]VVE15640.1 hypothetical protein PCO31110_02902 [Pandoraea communis]